MIDDVFQSTHPSGVRLRKLYCYPYCVVISIHAPQWGATHTPSVSFSSSIQFQSTHPSGVRLDSQRQMTVHRYFNPRTPVGCDSNETMSFNARLKISIHAPQWGATKLF